MVPISMRGRTTIAVAAIAALAALAGCTSDGTLRMFSSDYGSRMDAGYHLPAIPIYKVDRKYHRQIVRYPTDENPGTIIIDTTDKYLYFVLPDARAVRYGIGVGRQGFEWKGTARVAQKREWPVWTPPAEMIRRQPELARFAGGMPIRVSAMPSAPAPSISTIGTATPAIGCTARRNGGRSATLCRPAASG